VGSATGFGTIAVRGGSAGFAFEVQRRAAGGPATGRLGYWNLATGERVESVEIGALTIAGDTATFEGTCTRNGARCTFRASAEDRGGRGQDTFAISVDPGGSVGGELQVGDVAVR
jgi:hypothetical protein